jgi:type II secretory pathway component PulM
MKELFLRLREFAAGLSPRERGLLGAVAASFGAMLFWLFIVQPVLGARDRAEARVATAEQELVAVLGLRREYDEIRGRLAAVEQRIEQGPRGNIFTLLESLAARSSLKVESMEPQAALASDKYKETKVQVVLKNVNLAQAVQYLEAIESAEQLLSVKSLRVRTRRDQPQALDVTFTVSSFEPVS